MKSFPPAGLLLLCFAQACAPPTAATPLAASQPLPKASSEKPAAELLHLNLEADGHTCRGRLRAHHGHLYWKSSFSVCDSPFQVIAHDASSWTLALTGPQGKGAHACSLHTVKVILIAPSDYALWQVVGFQGSAATASRPGAMVLACNMQSSRATGDSVPHD